MNILRILLFLMLTLAAEATVQKMVLSSNLETKEAAKDLYKIETFFQENASAKALQENYGLGAHMELLGDHVLVTVKPIANHVVKNKLYVVLGEHFPKRFVVDDTPLTESKPPKPTPEKTTAPRKEVKTAKAVPIKPPVILKEKQKETSFFDTFKMYWSNLQSEWIALLFLALAGFMLIYRSNRQISKIRTLQKEVELYQSKIEEDIEDMKEKRQ